MQISHDEAKLFTGFILAEYERERATTVRVMDAVPAGQESYAPDPKSMGALKLAWHIAASELYFFEGVTQGAFPKSGHEMPASVHGMADLLAWYNTKLPPQIDKAKSLSGEALSRLVEFHTSKVPAYALLQLMLKHSIHHRGQLSAYLRPMGGQVPSIYGPSADSK